MSLTTILILLAIVVAIGAYAYSFERYGQRAFGNNSYALATDGEQTVIDTKVSQFAQQDAAVSGITLITHNIKAFALRLETAQKAGRSLDLQYYYWKSDLTGRLLCLELIRAAERGVRVRLLLDDINSRGFDSTYLALDSHPNIDVRLFNPSRYRTSAFRRNVEIVLGFVTASRRMHNKSWIVDGKIAIVGGRNIGDAYFDAAETANFQDVDAFTTGKCVAEAQAIFDQYWNSGASVPIQMLHKVRRPKLKRLRRKLETVAGQDIARSFSKHVSEIGGPALLTATLAHQTWTRDAVILADPPEKADGKRKDLWLSRTITSFLQSAQQTVRITSPYFIPGVTGVELLRSLQANGVTISILTNSLATTDVAVVHGAYSKYRRALLEFGVSLFELKQKVLRNKISLFGSSTASLHTKTMIVDGSKGFIGSFNLDPRSASINTEMGIFFSYPVLARELQGVFEEQTSHRSAYAVSLKDDAVVWLEHSTHGARILSSEPNASWGRRVGAFIAGLLPIESQL